MAVNIALFDIAGTLVRGNPWLDVLRDPAIDRQRVHMQRIPVTAFWLAKKIRIINDTAFRHYWLHSMASILKGMTRSQIVEMLVDAIAYQEANGSFQEAVVAQLREHKARGDHIVLVSGMFDVYVQQYAHHFGADAAIGSPLAFDGDVCTGTMSGPTCNGSRKLEFIQDHLRGLDFEVDMAAGAAYADSYSDLPLLEAVGHPTATYPEDGLYEIARSRDWTILGTAQNGR